MITLKMDHGSCVEALPQELPETKDGICQACDGKGRLFSIIEKHGLTPDESILKTTNDAQVDCLLASACTAIRKRGCQGREGRKGRQGWPYTLGDFQNMII